MKRKVITINIVLSVISFLLGVLVCNLLQKADNKEFSYQNGQSLSSIESQIDTFKSDLENYQLTLSQFEAKEELAICNQMIFLYSHFPVVEYNIQHQRSNKSIITSIIDSISKVLPAINKGCMIDDYKALLLSLTNKNTEDYIKRCHLLFVENSLMNNYLSHVYHNSISLSYGELINLAPKDIIKLGETYRSRLIFSVKDVSGNKDLVELLDDTTAKSVVWDGTNFVETPTHRGKYHHDFLLFVTNFYGNKGWETSVDYEVK